MARSTAPHGLSLIFSFRVGLHDRSVEFNNGWTVKIGRGLDYFDRPACAYEPGTFDTNMRRCKATTVDIYHDSPS